MIAVTPTEVLAGILSTLFFLVGALILALSRLSTRLARVEEWVRIYERKNGAR